MDSSITRAYDLTVLGIRVFYTPVPEMAQPTESEFSYYSHSHPYYELHLLRSGCVTLQTAAVQNHLDPDTFCLVCPEVSHGLKSSIRGVTRCCIGLTVTDPEKPAGKYLLAQTQTVPCCTGSAKNISPVLKQLLAEDRDTMFSQEMTSQLLAQLVLQLLRSIPNPAQVSPVASVDPNALRTVHIDQFLNNNFHLQGAQQMLADELGLSRRQLDRVFQNLYGMCFREKLLQIRADAACDLLAKGIPIGQIALEIGYSSSSNFTAFFRNVKGMTPSEFRKNLQNY